MVLPYKVESYVEDVYSRGDSAKAVRYKIKDVPFKGNSRFKKLLSDIEGLPRVRSYEKSFQGYEHCFEVTDEIIERFQKIHESLPKDAITYQFLCDKKNIAHVEAYNKQNLLKSKNA